MRKNANYREQALKLFPWVCARCGRDFTGKQLRELTVHHKDHNQSNNPPDGSHWELLCIYCHDNEHQRFMEADARGPLQPDEEKGSTYKGLAGLGELFKDK